MLNHRRGLSTTGLARQARAGRSRRFVGLGATTGAALAAALVSAPFAVADIVDPASDAAQTTPTTVAGTSATSDLAPSGSEFGTPDLDSSALHTAADEITGGNASASAAGTMLDEFAVDTRAVGGAAANPLSSFVDALAGLINGTSPPPSTPGEEVGFSGSPSLLEQVLVSTLDVAKPFEELFGSDSSTAALGSLVSPLLYSASPPSWLTSLDGLTVTETDYDGMPVYDLTPADPSGQYVVAIHGGAYVEDPTIFHWLSFTDMARETGATVVVPIYPLAPEGTAGTVEPELADLISSEIATEGSSHVSVFGDSAGGGMALSAVQLLVSEGKPVPESMVLSAPTLELALSNPNTSLVDDPVLNLSQLQQDGLLWAGDLPLTNPLVSPLYGSLEGLPPTYVYSGSDDLLGPDVLVLEQDAIAEDAPMSFILRNGEIHDWALGPVLDGTQVQSQIYQELGLSDVSPTASTVTNELNTVFASLQNLGAGLSSFASDLNLGDWGADLTNAVSVVSNELTGLSGDVSAAFSDMLQAF